MITRMKKKKNGEEIDVYSIFRENGVNYAVYWDVKLNGFITTKLKMLTPLSTESMTSRNRIAKLITFKGECVCTDGAIFTSLSDAITHESTLLKEQPNEV